MENLETIVYAHPPLKENFSQYQHYTYISEETVMYDAPNGGEILILERKTKEGKPSALIPGFVVNYKMGKNSEGRYISNVIPVSTAERLYVAEFLRGMKTLKIDCTNLYFINNEFKTKKMSGRGGFPIAAI